MSMTETPAPAPAKTRRKAARKEKTAAAAKPNPFEGLTPADCCNGCSPERCVISGMNVCAHPYKGGLQSALQSKPDVLKRHRAARRFLAHAKIELGET
jgi:hypothetical protein